MPALKIHTKLKVVNFSVYMYTRDKPGLKPKSERRGVAAQISIYKLMNEFILIVYYIDSYIKIRTQLIILQKFYMAHCGSLLIIKLQ